MHFVKPGNMACRLNRGLVLSRAGEHMKKIYLTMFALIAFASLTALFAGAQDFTAVNHSGKTIMRIHVSESSNKSWEGDILGSDVLAPGASVQITFTGHTECIWDFLAVDEDGGEHRLDDANLCQLHTITIN